MEKILSFREKLGIILTLKGLTIKDLEDQWGKSGTIYKAFEQDRDFSDRLRDEFLLKFQIKKSWWKRPDGRTESDVFEANNTPAIKTNEKVIDEEEVYRNIVEGNTEYLLIPRTVLQEKYRMVPVEKIAQEERESAEKERTIRALIEIQKDLVKSLSEIKTPKVQKT